MIKMVNEFKLTVVHFARPNPMQILDAREFTAGQKDCGKSGLGRQASKPGGRRGPLGLRAAGPSRAAGPRGRWPAFSKIHF